MSTTIDDLTEEQLSELKEAFSLFDIDGDGTINAKELGTVLRSLGQNPTDKEVEEMIEEVDVDGSGSIEFPEFLMMMAGKFNETTTDKDLNDAFKIFDTENTGFISVDELKHLMTTMGERLSEEEMDEMVADANADSEGKVNYEEFVKLITSYANVSEAVGSAVIT
ncbi:calmodulin-like isoform X2 [Saccoglossus kowalevskii]|uniref:Calmodulin-like n=1 Tax=Saccoglossus kowalevskii TaxID=10224 RepID=A0ABM0GMF7_SACKO|nr:PREDICTED: calmodulin-like [Saccoglossus kowalevskii]